MMMKETINKCFNKLPRLNIIFSNLTFDFLTTALTVIVSKMAIHLLKTLFFSRVQLPNLLVVLCKRYVDAYRFSSCVRYW